MRLIRQVNEMKCLQSRSASAYIDKELDEEARTSFEKHLAGCPECSGRIAAFLTLRAGFASAGRHRAPLGFATRVLALARQDEQRRTSRLMTWLVGAAEAAVVACMIVTGIFAGRLLMTGDGMPQYGGTPSAAFDVFEPAPPDSLGGVYLAMTEPRHEN